MPSKPEPRKLHLDSAHNPDATRLGRHMLNDAVDAARWLRHAADNEARPDVPLAHAMRRIDRGTEYIARGAIATGLEEFDEGFEHLMNLNLIAEGD